MNRHIFDHVPQLLKYRAPPPHYNSFRYENCWIERDVFLDLVKEIWRAKAFHVHDIDKCQDKMRRLRINIKGWDINIEGEYKKEKKMLLERMDMWIKRGNCYPEYTRKRATSVNA
jgi:hypothetical protein